MVARLLRALMIVVTCGAAASTSACATETDDFGDDEYDDGDLDDEVDESSDAISVPGAWSAPAAVVRAGATARHPYERARGACSGSLLPGTRALGDEVERRFGRNIASPGRGLPAVQGYNCRRIRGSSARSIHGTGRALDIFVPRSGGKADNTKGDVIANWLVQNAAELGVQGVIWDRSVWTVKNKRVARYTGEHPHDDHVHVELVSAAAAKRLAWYRGR